MVRQLPMSDDSSVLRNSNDDILSGISNAPQGRSGRSAAMYVINQPPWKTGGTAPQGFPNLGGDVLGKRMALISPVNALRNLEEELDRELHQAQDNFAAVFHASPAILCILELDGLRYREINKVYEHCTGYKRSEVIGRTSLKLGLWDNADDRKRVVQKVLAKGHLSDHPAVFQTKAGERLTTLLSAEIIEFGGESCVLVIAKDITMHEEAEEARMELAQRLINAQEAERTRVARELHDNIGQSLALFTVELERMRQTLTGLSVDGDAKLGRLCGKLKALGQDVGKLSHQLHSTELELLGFAVAVKALCREFSESYHLPVNFNCFGVPDNLPADVSLCLFRVMQEALHNVAKHSRATRIDVELRGSPKSLHLRISDDGVGFSADSNKARAGLGLISMRERLHLIGGKFIIASKHGSGTRVEAMVNLTAANTRAVSRSESWV
jgi:PAS domain S-box-containing protein